MSKEKRVTVKESRLKKNRLFVPVSGIVFLNAHIKIGLLVNFQKFWTIRATDLDLEGCKLSHSHMRARNERIHIIENPYLIDDDKK